MPHFCLWKWCAPVWRRRTAFRLSALVVVGWVFLAVFASPTPAQSFGLLREVYQGLSGTSLANLTNALIYPNQPTSTNYLTDFFEAPSDTMDNYGQRIHGYLVAPQTGNYTFWIASDDSGALFLSTDDKPVNSRQIAYVTSWTSSREWTKEPNQQSAPIPLESGKIYYVSALMKEGSGGDNLSVRWRMPDGTDQAPLVATNCLPWGISFTAPQVVTPPANLTIVEGGTATFAVGLASPGLFNYQWQRNGTNLPGATSRECTIFPVLLADNGARFSVYVWNDKGNTHSPEAVLTVTPDMTAPSILQVQNLSLTRISVVFSEAMEAATATDPAHFRINNGIVVTGVQFGADNRTILLTTTPMTLGTAYVLTVNDLEDTAATPNSIAPDSQVGFAVVEYVPVDIGFLGQPSQDFYVTNGINLTSGGTGFDTNADHFHFSYQLRSGDFDLKTRIQSLSVSDLYTVAGLMARENLSTNCRFAAALATPATAGCFFRFRQSLSANTSASGYFPVNYPETWLRLARTGTQLTGYASLDGQHWTQLGAVSLMLPTTIYVGLAVASGTASQTATAEFRDVSSGEGGVVDNSLISREPLMPSSRHTSLIISEIMYHPPQRADHLETEFVELYNAGILLEDMTEYRLTGDIDYAFPPGILIPAGGFLVVARSPADVETAYGLRGVLGPYSNHLAQSGGILRLLNASGSVLLEAEFSNKPPYSAAADGGGHSLVLAFPSYGEGSPKAWAASEFIGGSPGRSETQRSNPYAAVSLNELFIAADEKESSFLELYNHSNNDVDLSGCWLTDDPVTNKFRIPEGTLIRARGFLFFDPTRLGFTLSAAGQTIYCVNPDLTRVIDAMHWDALEAAVAFGRSPDGAPTFRRLMNPTPGVANASWRQEAIVINEIMYHPISGDPNDEFVELHNCSDLAVDLSGWQFVDGIDFTFPRNTALPPRGYLVVAKDAARLMANYPQLHPANTVGDFQGTLRQAGERLALAKPGFFTWCLRYLP